MREPRTALKKAHSMTPLLCERLAAFADVPGLDVVPRRRGGRRITAATLHRWATIGLRGVVLEAVQVGGTRCTSKEAILRFFYRLSQARKGA